ncbi:GNAT family N-acetyltransferase [Streptomyces xiamenensis]|uniref:GNAT family N-acetyltransferase n=1 Tax=Streptomyces sp. NRRL F-2890 TaxID=1463845 RepID=UPI0005B7EC8D|nr:GNAT family N-acetyltransferase [Streptomyces sp. NRRL F-2890]
MNEEVRLVPWSDEDFWVLEACNTPAMTANLGGPESAEKLADRHRRYVALRGPGRMYRVELAATGETVGSIGYWEHQQDDGETVWETGWSVLSAFQGRGLAAAAAQSLIEVVRAAGGPHRTLHAYPRMSHGASNAVCRKAGFQLAGTLTFEYPKGHWETSHDWWVDVSATARPTAATP